MLRFAFWYSFALASSFTALCSPAAAQERLDSSLRAWADLHLYSGDVLLPGIKVTALTPVLHAELELSALQLGLDLPFALGATSIDGAIASGESGFGGRMGNPTLHVDYIVEENPMRASVGLALAIPTVEDQTGSSNDSDRAASFAAGTAVLSRGLWNMWWYTNDAWVLIVPATFENITRESELGLDGALAWFLRTDDVDNSGVFQLGAHAAAVLEPAVLGARLFGVFLLDERIAGSDQFQSSIELFAELRLPIVWLGAGIDVSLDEWLGVFGDGADMWSLRVSGGAAF